MISSNFANQATQYFEAYRSETSKQSSYQELAIGRGFNRGLAAGVGINLAPVEKNNPATPLFDVQKVIDTVASFIEGRIGLAKADGASDAELEEMLGQARKGVELGFSQAREEIAQVAKLSEPLAERIDAAENGIYDRVDSLEKRLFSDDEGVNSKLSQVESFSYAQSLVKEAASFDFTLVTQDGDRVKISAFEQASQFASSAKITGANGEISGSRFESSSRSAFSLSIKGDLDEGEALAIQDLLAQVSDLADEFYNGNLSVAFDLALKLQPDASEIAKFSLDLSSSKLEAVSLGEFRRAENADPYAKQTLPKGVAQPLADFAQNLKQSFELASQFKEPASLLESLLKQIEAQRALVKSAADDVANAVADSTNAVANSTKNATGLSAFTSLILQQLDPVDLN